MKIMVCGPIGYGNVDEIKELQKNLRARGFKIVNQFENEGMDYSHVKDFRNQKELADRIVKNDLEFIKKADVIVAICNEPSFGTAMEISEAKKLGKTVIVFSEKPLASPWPIAYSNHIVISEDELIELLSKLKC